jgi:type IV conjugative transfer system lipoprotein TraV
MPYKSNFQCPVQEKGTCSSVENTYEAAVAENGVKNDKSNMYGLAYVDFYKMNNLLNEMKECRTDKCKDDVSVRIRDLYSDKNNQLVNYGKARVETEKSRLEYMESLVRSEREQIPSMTDPIVMKIVIFPYKDKNGMLLGKRDMWRVVEPGTWVLGNSISLDEQDALGNVFK